MKFLYVDVKKRKLVAVFEAPNGKIHYWNKAEVIEQKLKHQKLSSKTIVAECDEAMDALVSYKQQRPWWKFW